MARGREREEEEARVSPALSIDQLRERGGLIQIRLFREDSRSVGREKGKGKRYRNRKGLNNKLLQGKGCSHSGLSGKIQSEGAGWRERINGAFLWKVPKELKLTEYKG